MGFYWQKEFDFKNFGFEHNKPIIFVTSPCGPAYLYPAWTVVALLYHLVALGIDGYQSAEKPGGTTAAYHLYLPNWGYILLAIYAFYDCATALYMHIADPDLIRRQRGTRSTIEVVLRNKVVNFDSNTIGEMPTHVPVYLKVGWALFSLAIPVAITITFTFWVLYVIDLCLVDIDTLLAKRLNESLWDFGTIAFNIVNCVMALLHVLISAKPFKLLHFYFPVTFFVIYALLTVIYQAATGEDIYKAVDWSNTFIIAPIVAIYLIIVPFFVHFLIHGLVYVRTKVGTYCQLRSAAWKIRRIRKQQGYNNRINQIDVKKSNVIKLVRRNSKVAPAEDPMFFKESTKQKTKTTREVESHLMSPISSIAVVSEFDDKEIDT